MRILELEFRNFNSYGNGLQKIDLRDPNFYLLYGDSGVGKSTIREVIGYLLYGNVDGKNMGDLPNRTNKKDLYGRILFETNGSVIELKRGMKPNIFDVTINGEPEDTAGKKNVQQILETEYYKIPQSTYNNIVTISIDKFKSFLNMSPSDKRKIIDQIFSFIVFNKVYEKLNRKVLDYNSELKNINGKITVLTESKLDITQKLDNMNSINKEKINEALDSLTPKIRDLQKTSKKVEDALATIKAKQDLIIQKDSDLRSDISTYNANISKYQTEIKNVNKQIDLYDLGKCPTCTSDLTTDYHKDLKNGLLETRADLVKKKEDFDKLVDSKNVMRSTILDASKKVQEKRSQLSTKLSTIKNNLSTLAQEYKMTKASGDNDSSEFDSILKNTIHKIDNLMNSLDNLSKEEFLYSEISKIFAEDGVKKQILKSVLPGLNKSINEFTRKLHFPYKIEIDDKFNSVITSMGANISVKTLSTGEHKKADFAVLISIIKIMKRNFPGINLLFLDELLGNIDGHGIYELLSLTRKIVDELDMNVFVINHSELPSEIFDYKIEVIKKNGFSEMAIEKT